MAYYETPADMFDARAKRYKRDGDFHWAMAKSGEGDYHYGKARNCYTIAASNREKAAQARANGAVW